MKIITSKKILNKIIDGQKNLGFVPTMGAIHKGHILLIKKSISLCDKTIVSIFVNKSQFNRKSDYEKYPRVLSKDLLILKKYKVDYLFLPTLKQIYPKGPNKKIKISPFEKKLCGKFRPGHFKAVTDVIDRFIKMIKPSKIFFGKKDMQQFKIIENFVKENKIKTKVIACKTIREKNGIPYSSRNFLLSPKEKVIASKVFKVIKKNKKNLINKRNFLKKIRFKMLKFGVKKIDYIKVLNINKLFLPYKKIKNYKIFIAYYLGTTRLIDNI